MQNFSASPREMVASLVRNRQLIYVLTKREVIGRYKGSLLGIFWSFFHPIFMLAVYTLVFSVVFKARWNGEGTSESRIEFAMVLFAGLMVFNFFSECVSRAPGLVLGNVNYVKKVIFPLETLPWVLLCSGLFHAAASFMVWLIFYVVFIGIPHPTILLIPVVALPLILLTLGLSSLLAAVGVYLRDVGQFVGLLMTVLMFLSPIFYPVTAVPEAYRSLLMLNPLSPAIQAFRDVLMWGGWPDWSVYGLYLAGSSLMAMLGFAFFQRTRKGFADVL